MSNSIGNIRQIIQTPVPPKQIHNYVYYPDRVLGRGNYSTVYEAYHLITKRRVAAKVICLSKYESPKMVELLEQQIQILLTLDHPNIIKCYDILKTSQECYCFTQLCEGGSLGDVLQQKGRLNEDEAWPYIRDIYEGLDYLNSKGIIHRDIKAHNIFINNEGVAKIADFGFAVHSRVSFTDLNIGSPVYMAPQGYIHNTYGVKTDVWAYGIVIYQLLHGHTPYSHIQDPQILLKALTVQLQPRDMRPQLSQDLKQLIKNCLIVDEKKRSQLGQIHFSRYMQRKLYSRYGQHDARKDLRVKENSQCEQALFRVSHRDNIQGNKSSRDLKVPSKKDLHSLSAGQETDHSSREPSATKPIPQLPQEQSHPSRIVQLKSKLKIDNKPITPSLGIIRLTTTGQISTPTIKITSPKIRIIEQNTMNGPIQRNPYKVSSKYYSNLYEPLSAAR